MSELPKQASTLADNELVPGLPDTPGTSLIFTEEMHSPHIEKALNAVVESVDYAFKPVTYRMFHSLSTSLANGKMHINTPKHTTHFSLFSPQGHPTARNDQRKPTPTNFANHEPKEPQRTDRQKRTPQLEPNTSIMWCCCKCGTAVTGSSKCSRCGHDKCSDCDSINEGKGK